MKTSNQAVAPRDWGDGCKTWELARHPDLAVFHERMPPGTAERAHWHETARQVFFVLEGTLWIQSGDTHQRLERHEAMEIAPGTLHVVSNRSDRPAEFLAISHPIPLKRKRAGEFPARRMSKQGRPQPFGIVACMDGRFSNASNQAASFSRPVRQSLSGKRKSR
jgi:mannose-6-phosphate isomerase-like protein (cupin superfamily)